MLNEADVKELLKERLSRENNGSLDVSSSLFPNDPVDKCLNRSLCMKDDPMLKFYEDKFKFPPKEIRPFAQHTSGEQQNPIYNEKLFETELAKI